MEGFAPAEPEAEVPLRIGTPEQNRRLIDLLGVAGYTSAAVSERLGIETIHDIQDLDEVGPRPDAIADGLDALICLFLAGHAVPSRGVTESLPAGCADLLRSLGLVRIAEGPPEVFVPNVMFYPVEGLFIASDTDHDPTLSAPGETSMRPDSVYPAIARNTGQLLRVLPPEPCEDALDMCSGTGIAALACSRLARRAWAVDVTARSTRFAEFNAAVNGIANVTVLEGDVYEPVAGRTFDRIIAHPPFVPSLEPDYIYRAGGEDGEMVTRRIIEGLGRHLRPGGHFYCSCMLTDRHDAPAEQRIRGMLGDVEDEFDVVLVTRALSTVEEFYGRSADRDALAGPHPLVDRLRRLGVQRMVLCVIVIRRHDGPQPAVTARRQAGAVLGHEQLAWLLDWETAAADPALPARLTGARPRISDAVRLELVSRADGGTWVPENCRIHTNSPFQRVLEVPTEVAQFVAGCTGGMTVSEQLARAKAAKWVPDEVTDEAFVATLLPLVGSGILTLEE